MLRLWPTLAAADDHSDDSPQVNVPDNLRDLASLPRQSVHLGTRDDGWLVTIDSPVETGTVEVFIPRNRMESARILLDSRSESTSRSFEVLYASGYYGEAVAVARKDFDTARHAVVLAGQEFSLNRILDPCSDECRRFVDSAQRLVMATLRTASAEPVETIAGEALAVCEAAPSEYAQSLIRLLHDRAIARYLSRPADEEQIVDASREFSQIRRRAEELLGTEHPDVARVMTSQARVLISDFSYPEAEQLLEQAIQIRTKALGADHPDVAESLLEQARLHAYREDDEEANDAFERTIAIRQSRCGADHPDVAEALFQYTDFLIYNRRDTAKAGPLLRRALAIWEKTIGLDHSPAANDAVFIQKVLSDDAETRDPSPT